MNKQFVFKEEHVVMRKQNEWCILVNLPEITYTRNPKNQVEMPVHKHG